MANTNPYNPISTTNPYSPITANSTPAFASGVLNKPLPPTPTTLNWKDSTGNLGGLPSLEGGAANNPLGIAYNTVVGLPRAAVKVAKDTGQFIAREAVGTGMGIGNVINKARGADITTDYTPTNPVGKAILGTDTKGPVHDISTQYANLEQSAKDNPVAKFLGLDKQNVNIAGTKFNPFLLAGFAGLTALDFTPFGGGKAQVAKTLETQIPENFLKFVANTTDKQVLSDTFKSIGVKDPVLVDKLANNLVDVTNKNEVKKVFMDTVNNHVTTEALPAGEHAVTPNPASPSIVPPIAEKPITQPTAEISPKEPTTPSLFQGETQSTASPKGLETVQEKAAQAQALSNKDLPPGEIPLHEPLDNIVTDSIDKSTPMGQRVAIWDYIRTPSKVLDKMGMHETYNDLSKGYESYLKELPTQIQKIRNWADSVPAASNEKIFRSLDGENIALDPAETKVKNEIKDYLSNWADRLGMKPDARISSYITHIFPLKSGVEIPQEIAHLINNKIPGSVYDPFLLQRQGAEGYLKDTWRALEAYTKRATRKVNMDPALGRLKDITNKMTEQSQLDYLQSYVNRINMRPTKFDNLIDNAIKQTVGYRFGGRPTASITQTLRMMTSRAKIGYSMTSWAKNLTQGVNTFAELGTRYTLRGYMDLAKFGGKELKDEGVLLNPFIEDRNVTAFKKNLERFDKGLFYNMQSSEFINRGAAYYGAKAKALNEGKSMEEAKQIGKDTAAKTQFQFSSLDSPVVMSSDIAKTALQFKTFGVKQVEFLAEMAKNKEWMKLFRYLAASTMLFGTIGTAFGMKWSDVMPTLTGGSLPSLDFPIRVFNAATGQKNQYGVVPGVPARLRDVGNAFLTDIVPGGTQLNRTFQGLQAVSQGKSTTASGKTQYKIEQTPANYIKAGLFGKSNLPQAQSYFDKKANPKSKSSKANPYSPI